MGRASLSRQRKVALCVNWLFWLNLARTCSSRRDVQEGIVLVWPATLRRPSELSRWINGKINLDEISDGPPFFSRVFSGLRCCKGLDLVIGEVAEWFETVSKVINVLCIHLEFGLGFRRFVKGFYLILDLKQNGLLKSLTVAKVGKYRVVYAKSK